MAEASFLVLMSSSSCFSTVGRSVLLVMSGSACGSYPMMRYNYGDFPVTEWGQMLWTNLAMGIHSAHSEGFDLQNILKYVLISWLTLSVSLSVWGWYADDRESSYPSILPSSFWNFAVNWGPRSDMILLNSPNLVYSFLKMIVAIPSAVIVFLVGHRITPLLSPWSTTTNRESKPFETRRSLMRS